MSYGEGIPKWLFLSSVFDVSHSCAHVDCDGGVEDAAEDAGIPRYAPHCCYRQRHHMLDWNVRTQGRHALQGITVTVS